MTALPLPVSARSSLSNSHRGKSVKVRRPSRVVVVLMLLAFLPIESEQDGIAAPGAPGGTPRGTNANKVGVGRSTTTGSKVWFTLGQSGAVDEVYVPALDSANTRALELIVTDGKTFAEI